jgi:phage terminase small subunit
LSNLKQQQIDFCEHYLANGQRGVDAAISAGYSAKTARSQAHKLLRKKAVKEYISAKKQELLGKLNITQEMIIEEMAKIAFANVTDYLDWNSEELIIKPSYEIPAHKRAAIAEISRTYTKGQSVISFKLHPKLAALIQLGKHLGIFQDKVQVTGKDDQPINVNLSIDEKRARVAELLNRTGADRAISSPGSIK